MKIKVVAFPVALMVVCMFVSDLFTAIGMRRLSHGDSLNGTKLLAAAERLNPVSFNTKTSEIESLFAFYRGDSEAIHLQEAVRISRELVRLYPGNAQAWGVYATATAMLNTHPAAHPIAAGWVIDKAISMDPISVPLIEDYLFLLAANRYDYAKYVRLGILRTSMTPKRLTMVCPLDGKPWLEHR